MSYEGLVCRLKNIRKHNNADRLKVANVSGYQIIVGLDSQEGDLGIFFGPEGRLLHEHLFNNNLYSNPELNLDTEKKGYFGKNGKIRAQKLRGEISEGFWQEISAFNWCGPFDFKEGQLISEINGHKICEKFISQATQKALNAQKNKQKKNLWKRWKKLPLKNKFAKFFPYLWLTIIEVLKTKEKNDYHLFKEHYDTKQLRQHLNSIPEDALCYISVKTHGTSGRTSRTLTNKKYIYIQV